MRCKIVEFDVPKKSPPKRRKATKQASSAKPVESDERTHTQLKAFYRVKSVEVTNTINDVVRGALREVIGKLEEWIGNGANMTGDGRFFIVRFVECTFAASRFCGLRYDTNIGPIDNLFEGYCALTVEKGHAVNTPAFYHELSRQIMVNLEEVGTQQLQCIADIPVRGRCARRHGRAGAN